MQSNLFLESFLFLSSGYENGNVVVLCAESKDTSAFSCREVVCSIGEPLRKLHLLNSVAFQSSCRFLAGTESGRLLLHRVRYQSSSTASVSAWYGAAVAGVATASGKEAGAAAGGEGKTVVLFSGAGSPVCNIACYHSSKQQQQQQEQQQQQQQQRLQSAKWEEGNIVAWADLCTVRIMDIATQTAICYLNAPAGVGVDLTSNPTEIQCPCPCLLFL